MASFQPRCSQQPAQSSGYATLDAGFGYRTHDLGYQNHDLRSKEEQRQQKVNPAFAGVRLWSDFR